MEGQVHWMEAVVEVAARARVRPSVAAEAVRSVAAVAVRHSSVAAARRRLQP